MDRINNSRVNFLYERLFREANPAAAPQPQVQNPASGQTPTITPEQTLEGLQALNINVNKYFHSKVAYRDWVKTSVIMMNKLMAILGNNPGFDDANNAVNAITLQLDSFYAENKPEFQRVFDISRKAKQAGNFITRALDAGSAANTKATAGKALGMLFKGGQDKQGEKNQVALRSTDKASIKGYKMNTLKDFAIVMQKPQDFVLIPITKTARKETFRTFSTDTDAFKKPSDIKKPKNGAATSPDRIRANAEALSNMDPNEPAVQLFLATQIKLNNIDGLEIQNKHSVAKRLSLKELMASYNYLDKATFNKYKLGDDKADQQSDEDSYNYKTNDNLANQYTNDFFMLLIKFVVSNQIRFDIRTLGGFKRLKLYFKAMFSYFSEVPEKEYDRRIYKVFLYKFKT